MKQQSGADRRQFGRRWNQVQGWITIDGRPRISCSVQNLSDGGAQLAVAAGVKLPTNFYLVIDALKMRVGCTKVRDIEGVMGVRFLNDEEMAKAQAAIASPPSTYQLLLAEASAEYERQQQAEEIAASPGLQRLAMAG